MVLLSNIALVFIPEALETGAALQDSGYRALAGGIAVGVSVMVPLLYV